MAEVLHVSQGLISAYRMGDPGIVASRTQRTA